MTETPQGFEDIDPKVLRTQAVEDWAVEVKPSDSLKKVVKAFEDAGVFWDDYAERYGYNIVNTLDEPDSVEEVGELTVEERTPEPTRAEKPVADVKRTTPRVQVAQPVAAQGDVPYLIKMDRANIKYQVGKYTFTKEHPYALVDPADVEFVLTHEPGFRQALPSEVSEFYA